MLYPEGVKVIVKPVDTEKVSSGGIIIPEPARERKKNEITRGHIVAIGPTANISFSRDGVEKIVAKIDDEVIFAQWGGAIVNEEKEDGTREPLRILNDEDIVCLIR